MHNLLKGCQPGSPQLMGMRHQGGGGCRWGCVPVWGPILLACSSPSIKGLNLGLESDPALQAFLLLELLCWSFLLTALLPAWSGSQWIPRRTTWCGAALAFVSFRSWALWHFISVTSQPPTSAGGAQKGCCVPARCVDPLAQARAGPRMLVWKLPLWLACWLSLPRRISGQSIR